MILDKETLTMKFYSNFQRLTELYIQNNDDIDSLTGKNGIYNKMCEKYEDIDFVSESTFKEWCYGKSIPKPQHLILICDYFNCDLDYLFGINEGIIDKDGKIVTSQIETYIKDTYGLDKKTLDMLSKYKSTSIIASIDDPVSPASNDLSFVTILNRIVQKYPWLISNIGQILYAKPLNLSSEGFGKESTDAQKYYYYEDLFEDFDETIALTLLSVRLKKILADTDYVPNKENIISTFDFETSNPDTIDKYITDTMTARLRRLESTASKLSELLTEVHANIELEDLNKDDINKLL